MNQESDNITNSLGYILIDTAIRLKDEVRKGFMKAGFDVTADRFAVLIRLWSKDGLSQRDLSDKCSKSKSNMTRILDSMEKKGLVSRRTNKGDRRSFSIYLTDKGRSLQNDLLPLAIHIHDRIFKGVTEKDQKQMLNNLEIILSNIE